MPRTKITRKKTVEVRQTERNTSELDKILNEITTKRTVLCSEIDEECNVLIRNCRNFFKQQMFEIPVKMTNKSISEISNESSTTMFSSCINASVTHLLSSTKTKTAKKGSQLRRSKSSVDEGYLTAESSRGTSGGRQSRQQIRTNSSRVSRSLSRNKMPNANALMRNMKTPINRAPLTTYGTVTPKLKPNTPQVLLRRPKQGEVALSLQGSPLFTGTVASETVANINIPLVDGRLLSIQPERGLRLSQIPQLDLETKRQLETLRDNLNKVCAVTAHL